MKMDKIVSTAKKIKTIQSDKKIKTIQSDKNNSQSTPVKPTPKRKLKRKKGYK